MLSHNNHEIDDLIFLSALNHYLYCPRRSALIHIEQIWTENLFTAEGRIMHERVDTGNRESRGTVRVEYAMPLRSLRLGLIGKADVVEFHKKEGRWIPFPVEYKRGKPKVGNYDRVQLCAQALCLEEMLNVAVPCGALFYGKIRRREEVTLDSALRVKTEDAAKRLHDLFSSGVTPKPIYTKKCKSCSLLELCLPEVAGKMRSVERYLTKVVQEA